MPEVKYFTYTVDGINISVPYYEFTETINGTKFRKVKIVDIRNIDYQALFSDFDRFQEAFISQEYFDGSKIPIMLYFITHNNSLDSNYFILNNMKYAFKSFITKDALPDILARKERTVLERSSTISFNESNLDLGNFNVLYGPNASGKSFLLKSISQQLQAPIFLPMQKYDEPDVIFTSVADYLKNMQNIMAYCRDEQIPLILDDFPWNHFDGRNTIKTIDTLVEESFTRDVYVNAFNSTANLIRKRAYKPNMINLAEINKRY